MLPTDPGSTICGSELRRTEQHCTPISRQHGFQRVCLGPGSAPGGSPDRSPGTSSAPLINIKKIDSGNLANGGYTISIVLSNTHSSPMHRTGFHPLLEPHFSYFTYAPPLSGCIRSGMEIRRYVQAPSYIDAGLYCAPFASNANLTEPISSSTTIRTSLHRWTSRRCQLSGLCSSSES